METKHCPSCNEDKPRSEFFSDRRNKNGLSSYCKACTAIRTTKYREKNRDKVNLWAREQTKRDTEKRIASGWVPRRTGEEVKQHKKEYQKEWRKNNLSRLADWFRNYRKKNPEYYRDADRKKKYKRRGAVGSYTQAQFRELCERYGNCCLRCGRTDVKLTPDHVVPISKGGSNTIDNLQPLCMECNNWKRTQTIDYR